MKNRFVRRHILLPAQSGLPSTLRKERQILAGAGPLRDLVLGLRRANPGYPMRKEGEERALPDGQFPFVGVQPTCMILKLALGAQTRQRIFAQELVPPGAIQTIQGPLRGFAKNHGKYSAMIFGKRTWGPKDITTRNRINWVPSANLPCQTVSFFTLYTLLLCRYKCLVTRGLGQVRTINEKKDSLEGKRQHRSRGRCSHPMVCYRCGEYTCRHRPQTSPACYNDKHRR